MNVDYELKKMTVDSLDKQIEAVDGLAKEYEVTRLPLNLVNKVIDDSKVKVKYSTNKRKQAINLYKKRFNETLDTIKKLCKENSDVIGDGKMTPEHFNLLVNHVKNQLT